MHGRALARDSSAAGFNQAGRAGCLRSRRDFLCRRQGFTATGPASGTGHRSDRALRFHPRDSSIPASHHSRAQQRRGQAAGPQRTSTQNPSPAGVCTVLSRRISSLRELSRSVWIALRSAGSVSSRWLLNSGHGRPRPSVLFLFQTRSDVALRSLGRAIRSLR